MTGLTHRAQPCNIRSQLHNAPVSWGAEYYNLSLFQCTCSGNSEPVIIVEPSEESLVCGSEEDLWCHWKSGGIFLFVWRSELFRGINYLGDTASCIRHLLPSLSRPNKLPCQRWYHTQKYSENSLADAAAAVAEAGLFKDKFSVLYPHLVPCHVLTQGFLEVIVCLEEEVRNIDLFRKNCKWALQTTQTNLSGLSNTQRDPKQRSLPFIKGLRAVMLPVFYSDSITQCKLELLTGNQCSFSLDKICSRSNQLIWI